MQVIYHKSGRIRLFESQDMENESCKLFGMSDQRNIHTVYCNHCKRDTHFAEMVGDGRKIQPFNGDKLKDPPMLIYRLIQCLSCGMDITFYIDYMGFRGYMPPRNMEPGVPFEHLPPRLHRIYREVYRCLHIQARILTAIGIRAIVEGVCAAKEVKDGITLSGKRKNNLEGKINGLLEKQIINQSQCDALHSFRFMGNEAAHELEEPALDELLLAIQILESVLRSTFELPEKVKALGRIKSESEAKPAIDHIPSGE